MCEVVIQYGDDISDKGEDAVFSEGFCQAWIHRRCLVLSKKLYDNLGKSNDPFLCAYCALCKQSQEIDKLKRLISPLTSQSITNQSVQVLSDEISHLKSKLESDSSSQVEQIANTNSIAGNKKLTQVPSSKTSTKLDRKFNLVFYGIEESPPNTMRSERLKAELSGILGVIDNLVSNIDANSIKDYHRLGKYNLNRSKPRPIVTQFAKTRHNGAY